MRADAEGELDPDYAPLPASRVEQDGHFPNVVGREEACRRDGMAWSTTTHPYTHEGEQGEHSIRRSQRRTLAPHANTNTTSREIFSMTLHFYLWFFLMRRFFSALGILVLRFSRLAALVSFLACFLSVRASSLVSWGPSLACVGVSVSLSSSEEAVLESSSSASSSSSAAVGWRW